MGTNKAFIGKGDGSGQSTKATTQQLLMPRRFQKNANIAPLPAAGEIGTDKAFIGKGDGAGQSTKARTQELLMPRRFLDATKSRTQHNLQVAEAAAGLVPSVLAKEHLVPHAKKAATQALMMPGRFRKPASQAQRTRYEVGRAVGAHSAWNRPMSAQAAAEEARNMAKRQASANRAADRKKHEALHRAQQSVRRAAVGGARTEELSSQYLDFGRKARSFYAKHGLMTPAEDKWADKLQSGWEKAPVTMLAQLACGRGGPCSAVPEWNLKHGITSPKEAAWSKTIGVESAADKGRTTQLSMSDDFDPQAQGDDNYATGISAEVHRQYPGVNDQQGFPSTGMLRAPIQSLLLPERYTPDAMARAREAARAVAVPNAFGTLGTAAPTTDPVFQAKVATGVAQLKQFMDGAAPNRRIGDGVAEFLFAPSHAVGF